jgi:MFS family permease
VGLLPDGNGSSRPVIENDPAVDLQDSVGVGLTVKEAARTSAFWIIAVALSTLSMLVTGMFFHQVSIFQNHGLPPQIAAWVFSISAISMVAFTPLLGHMLDRLPTKHMFAGALLIMSAASISLVFVSGVVSAIAYSVIFGLANAAIHTHMAYLWPRFFGRRHLGSIQGAAQTIGVVGASIGPLPLGIAFDLFGTYSGALLLLAGLPVVCATLVLFMKPPKLRANTHP